MIEDIKPVSRKPAAPLPKQNPILTPQPEPRFAPPEQVARHDEVIQLPEQLPTSEKPKNKRRLSKKQWWLVGVGVFLLLIAAGAAAYFIFIKKEPVKPAPVVVVKKVEPPKPTTVASKLTGLQVQPEINDSPVTGVIIENSPDARPQSGLTTAGTVYEAIAEGGITRFMAVFEGATPAYVGPIRSVRPYYLDFIMPYDAGIAHVGGSPEALADIKALSIKDLDQFANSKSYNRVNNRYAPHNMYSGIDKLSELQKSKGWKTSNFLGFARKVDAPAATPTARSVDIATSSFLYNSHYDYDAATNSYKRVMAGKPHIDEKSGAQISPKVILALVMTQGIAADRVHTKYGTVGSGKLYIFQDGVVTEGIWEKKSRKEAFKFGDANGSPIGINTGQTWVTIVGAANKVTFKP